MLRYQNASDQTYWYYLKKSYLIKYKVFYSTKRLNQHVLENYTILCLQHCPVYSLILKKPTTEFRGKNCIGACETRGAREVQQIGEGHVHQCETVVRCAAGKSEPFAVEVGLH